MDADHENDGALIPLEDNPIWQQDNVLLHSVGIDIGSSGTQVVFSRLHVHRKGAALASRYVVVDRAQHYRSPVWFTPYRADGLIDAVALGSIIDGAYAAAGRHPDDVDTGVVILTGNARLRDNAQRIAETVAARAGDFVCTTAGHHMEARLAAHGSGAAGVSVALRDRVLNIDIGGGTTKLALVENGRVQATAALHVGGRLQVVGSDGRIVRLEPAGQEHAARAGFAWSVGDVASGDDLDRVAMAMADMLVAALTDPPLPPDQEWMHLTEPLGELGSVAGVMFSGGVADYVYERETRDFADLGRRLGAAIRTRVESGSLPYPLLPAGECIRATALGASEYSVQLSGSTCYISAPERLLPRRNLQVLRPSYRLGGDVDADEIAGAIRSHLNTFDLAGTDVDVVVALSWSGPPSHERLLVVASGVEQGLADRISRGRPIYLVLDGDVALSLGAILREELGVSSDMLVIDSLTLYDFDFIDLGRVRVPSNTVPVTIKSLVFQDHSGARSADSTELDAGTRS